MSRRCPCCVMQPAAFLQDPRELGPESVGVLATRARGDEAPRGARETAAGRARESPLRFGRGLGACVHDLRQGAARVRQQRRGGAQRRALASVHDEDPVEVYDALEAVGDAKQRTAFEGRAHEHLELPVGLEVDGRRGLVEHHDAGVAQQATCEGHQLALPCTEAASTCTHLCVQCHGGELGLLQRGLELRILTLEVAKGIEVQAHGAREQHGALRDHADAGAQLVQADLRDVGAIDADATPCRLHQPEQQHEDGGLARACPAHDAEALARGDAEREVAHGQGEARPVSQVHLLEVHAAARSGAGALEARLVPGAESGAGRPGLHGHAVGAEVKEPLQGGEGVVRHDEEDGHDSQEVRRNEAVGECQAACCWLHAARAKDCRGRSR
mmetsp:Transcript_12413/g.35271  ORF Transcript_12413/g.35271 Transcript_12413/m.35271 type:complete len:386 (+) Transcript_12413:80-1237(+)